MDYFVYKGIDSRVFGVYTVMLGGMPMLYNFSPPKRIETQRISGKHGEFITEETYEPRVINKTLYFTQLDARTIQRVSKWLGGLGVGELWFSTEPYKVYIASVEQEVIPEIYNTKQAIVEVDFVCNNPFGYSKLSTMEYSGVQYNSDLLYNTGMIYSGSLLSKWSFSSSDLPNLDVYHLGNSDYALPKITINGSASSINIKHFNNHLRRPSDILSECSFGSFSGELIIDSKISEVYLNGDVNNTTFVGDYFELYGMDYLNHVYSHKTNEVNSNSVKLGINASGVDDFYNGKVILLVCDKDNKLIYATINSYNATTKVIYFDNNNEIITNGIYQVFIYDFHNKANYFAVTGTGLSVSNISFDFKHTFL